jgi:hypothetical protein
MVIDMFKNRNHITFDIQHLTPDQKRQEIQKFAPLHYIFGYKLVSKPWLTYKEFYGITT